MEIYERIKELRKLLELTQEEFAEKINISRSNLGNIETNRVAITERIITDICNTYGASEIWLKTGEGRPLIEKDKYLFAQIKRLFDLDNVDMDIIDAYVNLPVEYRELFRDYIKLMVAHENKKYEDYLERSYPHIFSEPVSPEDKNGAGVMAIARQKHQKERKQEPEISPINLDERRDTVVIAAMGDGLKVVDKEKAKRDLYTDK